MGVMNPVVPPMQFTIPYTVPAKFGARSCEFWRLVNVEAPFMPNAKVRKITAKVELHPLMVWAVRNIPGII